MMSTRNNDILEESMTGNVADVLERHARERLDAPALTFAGTTLSWGELDRRAERVARGLLSVGVGPGDRVAFYDKNCPEYFELLFGAAKLGAVTVAVNWRLAAPEVAYVLNDAGAGVVVVGGEFADLFAKVEPLVERSPQVIAIERPGGETSFARWRDADRAAVELPERRGEVALQLYTSGTTGAPKGAMLTHANVATMLRHMSEYWRFTPDSVNLVCMPLFHIGGTGYGLIGMEVGAHTVLTREVRVPELLELIPRHRATHINVVAAVILMLLDDPGFPAADLSSLRVLIYGASPITQGLLARLLAELDCDVFQAYGLTEATGPVIGLTPEEHRAAAAGDPERLRSCGRPHPWTELRIVDPETGGDCEDGAVGELWTRSAQNFAGYWGLAEETAAALTADGWLRTGDAGYRDEDGYVFLFDRVKDMIVSGGENVYPAEVESALSLHPRVADVAVIGVPDAKWGEAVKAIVVPTDGAEPDPAELIAFARERIAGYKVPKSVAFVAELPRNPAGKLLKRELREPYWAEEKRRVH